MEYRYGLAWGVYDSLVVMHHRILPDDVIESIRSRIRYVKSAGRFYWKTDGHSYGGAFKKGSEVKGTRADGHIQIGITGRCYRAHHLAWILVTGASLPAGQEIHHRDGDWENNRWRNLQAVTRKQHVALATESASDRNRRLWQDPAYRKARAAAFARPDVKQRRSAALSEAMLRYYANR